MIGILLALSAVQAPAPEAYRALFLRAAPGRLVELIDTLKARQTLVATAGEARPLLLRHAQGDQWDVMVLQPIGTLTRYFSRDHRESWDALVAWQEELFVSGPTVEVFRAAAANSGYFHLEIFQSLAGRRDSLLAERKMENSFLTATQRPTNLIFTRTAGAGWDVFTIGFYRDLQHYAEPSSVSTEQEDRAAVAAGFGSRGSIGPTLRRYINNHHDTLGSVIP